MPYGHSDFAEFWQAAAEQIEVSIIGGGRWGLIWAAVLSKARGSGSGITLYSRGHASAARAMLDKDPATCGVCVVEGKLRNIAGSPRRHVAIVASRPAHHAEDALRALDEGADVLVEKPFTANPRDAASLLRSAHDRGLTIGIGTEFAFLPGFHSVANDIEVDNSQIIAVRLIWEDPKDEVRHGMIKRPHDEVSFAEDILPHAVSIFGIYCDVRDMKIMSKKVGGEQGSVCLTDDQSRLFELSFDRAGLQRKRMLLIEQIDRSISIDFAARDVTVSLNASSRAVSVVSEFDSTLRLAFGAFLQSARHRRSIPTVETLPRVLISLHENLIDAALP